MAKKTKSPATGAFEHRDEGPVGGTRGSDRSGDKQTGFPTSEDSPASGGRKSGPTGLQPITQAAIDATEFEEPTNTSENTIRTRPMEEE